MELIILTGAIKPLQKKRVRQDDAIKSGSQISGKLCRNEGLEHSIYDFFCVCVCINLKNVAVSSPVI